MIRLLLLLLSPVCLADVSVGGFYSEDTENNRVEKVSAAVWWNQFQENEKGVADADVGIQYTKLKYSNDLFSINGESVGLLIDYRKDDLWVMGNASVANLEGEYYVASDLSFLYFLNRKVILNGGVYSDVVDSPNGLLTSTTIIGYYGGIESTFDYFSTSLLLRQSFFSDDNRRDSILGKIYTLPYKGFFLYGSYLENNDTNPDTNIYWSPKEFIRKDVGIGVRKRIYNTLIFGHIDRGVTSVEGFKSYVNSWRFGLESDRGEWYRVNVIVGQDLNAFNYEYSYINASFKIEL